MNDEVKNLSKAEIVDSTTSNEESKNVPTPDDIIDAIYDKRRRQMEAVAKFFPNMFNLPLIALPVMSSPKVSPVMKMVLLAVYVNTDDEVCEITAASIAESIGSTPKTVGQALRKLCELNVISWEGQRTPIFWEDDVEYVADGLQDIGDRHTSSIIRCLLEKD